MEDRQMAYEKKNGDLAVFKNDRKEKDSQPDYTITGLGLDGTPIKGALWLKEDRNGKKFMAGKIEVDQYLIDKQGGAGFSGGNAGGVSGGGGGRDHQESERRDSRQTYDLDSDIPFVRW
jgi:hypothetical protein